jgi:hypothetical protein
MERAQRRRQITGSRVGYVSSGLVVVQRRGDEQGIARRQHRLRQRLLEAADYWCLQDNYWRPALRPASRSVRRQIRDGGPVGD